MDWDKTKFGLLSAAGGAIVAAVIGFNWGGWLTNGSAEAMAKETAANAVAERLGSICVAQANRDSQKGQKLSEMKGQDAWERGRSIEKLSWAIMPGDEKADSKVADACAKLFAEKDFIAKSDSAQIAR
jgi:dienelactone hydrolase